MLRRSLTLKTSTMTIRKPDYMLYHQVKQTKADYKPLEMIRKKAGDYAIKVRALNLVLQVSARL